jgi:hypothetical protein
MDSPDLEDSFPTATAIAVTLFDAVIQGNLPLRLPLGQDSWEGIYGETSGAIETLNNWRAVSERPANFS